MNTTLNMVDFKELFDNVNQISPNKIEIFDTILTKDGQSFNCGMFTFNSLLEAVFYIIFDMIKDGECDNNVYYITETFNMICNKKLLGMLQSDMID